VYFPGIGWVEFEPTGNQEPLRRPLTAEAADVAGNPAPLLPGPGLEELEQPLSESGASPLEPAPFDQSPAAPFVWTIAWAALAALAYTLNRRFDWSGRLPVALADSYRRNGAAPPRWLDRWAHWSTLGSIERSFQAVNLSLYWLGRPQPVHVTAVGRATVLQSLLPAARDSLAGLLREHQSALFSPHPGDPVYARRAALDILLKTIQTRARRVLERITGAPIETDGTS
jgi:hypothetical protein